MKGMLETELPQFALAANSVKNTNDLKREEYMKANTVKRLA